MSPNPFADLYQAFSNRQLYEILQNPNDYQPAALEAAQMEFQSRRVSPEEMGLLEQEWENLRLQDQRKVEKRKFLFQKVKTYGNMVADELSPTATQTTDRNIRMICIGTGLVILYMIFSQIFFWTFVFKGLPIDPFLFIDFLPAVIVPIGIWKFWHKKRSGWAILVIWLCFLLLSIVYTLTKELLFKPDSGILGLVYPETSIEQYLLALVIFGGSLVYLNMPVIKNAFEITKSFQSFVLFVLVGLPFLLFLMIIYLQFTERSF